MINPTFPLLRHRFPSMKLVGLASLRHRKPTSRIPTIHHLPLRRLIPTTQGHIRLWLSWKPVSLFYSLVDGITLASEFRPKAFHRRG
jgi:hypothetical protein